MKQSELTAHDVPFWAFCTRRSLQTKCEEQTHPPLLGDGKQQGCGGTKRLDVTCCDRLQERMYELERFMPQPEADSAQVEPSLKSRQSLTSNATVIDSKR
eukprot:3551584-Amphidinium_carterae.1